ncbi:type II secretion system F family protein [Candidatus Parcubacteria bacterium]|nr:type II secretion system F family protein [Patescibacteria group bacterium]MBU4466755.1 type II secretion system F family protein [Patescibacteria group bacterium]MCG2688510.1 type II secretion system F family protein [Candidatus Parcubacteria bacterium]
MAHYSYIAKSQQGETKLGLLEAKDETELSASLRQQGLFLISYETKKKPSNLEKFSFILNKGVGIADKIFFIRNLQVMTSAGVSLPKTIGILSGQAKNKNFRKALAEIQRKIIDGGNLSDGMANYPDIFPEIFQNMIKVGEESGTLEQVLKSLSRQLEKEYELKTKITGALIYPLVVISAMIAIGFAMLIIVVPQLAETFAELEISLPLTTRILIGVGQFLKEKWYLLPLIIAAGVIFLKQILKIKSVKRLFDKVFLKTPLVSKLVSQINSASFTRTLGSLMASGIPLVRSLEIIAGTLGNVYFKDSLADAAEQIKKGAKLSDALKPYSHLYLPIVIQMIEVGEETGETSNMLAQLAGFLEDEVANTTKNLAAAIEPILMLVVGAAVGFFAVSMIQPMYSMLEGIQ